MASTQEASVKAVLAALDTFSGHPDKIAIENANRWLQDFRNSADAWATCNYLLLSPDVPPGAKTFAAQTFRAKITFDLQQLDAPQKAGLRDTLISALEKFSTGPRVVLTQICLSLSGLALQMPEWQDPVGQLIKTFGQTPQHVQALLSFLTVLPEEVTTNSRIPMSDDEYRAQASSLLSDNAVQVLKLLAMYIQAQGVTLEIQAQIFNCLRSWVVAGEVDITEFSVTPLFSFAFEALTSEELFDSAVDVICDIIHETQEVDDNMQVIEVIVKNLLAIRPLVTSARGTDDEDPDPKMRGFCRIFTEAGETYRQLILAHPETFFPIVDTIAECSAVTDLDIVEVTFNFWYRLAQTIGKKPSVPSQFYELYRGLLSVMIRHLHFPPDSAPLVGQDLDDFRSFRHIMGDTLKDCCYVLGTATCLRAVFDMVVVALSRPPESVSWQEIEAPLFSMRSMGAEVDPNDDDVVPLIMDLLPRLPDHPQVRYAATLVISRYTEWVDMHPQYIEFQLGYISTGFSSMDSQVSAAAGQAMKYLCKDCKRHLAPYLPQLHTFVSTIGQKLPQDDQIQVYEAIAHVISSMPMGEAAVALRQFSLEIIARIHSIVSSASAASKDQLQQITDDLERIDVMLKVIRSFGEELPPACQTTAAEIWPVLDRLLSVYGGIRSVSDHVCSTLRFGLEFFGTGAPGSAGQQAIAALVPSLLERLAATFDSTGFPCFIWISGKAIRLFGNEDLPELRTAFSSSFERISAQVSAVLAVQSPTDHPDLVEDYVHFMLVMIEYCPDILFHSPSFPAGFRVILAALTLYHPEIIRPAMDVIEGILDHPSLKPIDPSQPSIPSFPIFARAIRAVVDEQGFQLTGLLLAGLLDNQNYAFDQDDMVGSITILFRRLAEGWGQQLVTWITVALERIPTLGTITPASPGGSGSRIGASGASVTVGAGGVSAEGKQALVAEFSEAVRLHNTDKIKAAIMALYRQKRRTRDRDRFTALGRE